MTAPETEHPGRSRRGLSIRARLTLGLLLLVVLAFIPAFLSFRYLGEAALRDVVTFLMMAVVTLLLLIAFLPRQLIRPIRKITAALRQAETGNLNVSSPRSRVPELDALAVSLNRTLGRLRHFDGLKTRRVREEQRLRSALLAAADAGLAVLNPEGRITDSNEAFRELVGRANGEISGHPIADILGEGIRREIRKVQNERTTSLTRCWIDAEGPVPRELQATIMTVKDEVEGPPRIVLKLTRTESSNGGSSEG